MTEGTRIWRVDAERSASATFYVLAPTREAAYQDADILADGVLTDVGVSDDVYTAEVDLAAALIDEHGVWTGGPDGQWFETRETFDRWLEEQAAVALIPKPLHGQLDVFGGEVA